MMPVVSKNVYGNPELQHPVSTLKSFENPVFLVYNLDVVTWDSNVCF